MAHGAIRVGRRDFVQLIGQWRPAAVSDDRMRPGGHVAHAEALSKHVRLVRRRCRSSIEEIMRDCGHHRRSGEGHRLGKRRVRRARLGRHRVDVVGAVGVITSANADHTRRTVDHEGSGIRAAETPRAGEGRRVRHRRSHRDNRHIRRPGTAREAPGCRLHIDYLRRHRAAPARPAAAPHPGVGAVDRERRSAAQQ